MHTAPVPGEERLWLGVIDARDAAPVRTHAALRQELLRTMPHSALTVRWARRAHDADLAFSPFAVSSMWGQLPHWHLTAWYRATRPDAWRKDLRALVLQLRQALEGGFNAADLAALRRELQTTVQAGPPRTAEAVADRLLGKAMTGSTPFAWSEGLAAYRRLVAELTPELLHKTLRRSLDLEHCALLLYGRPRPGGLAPVEVAALRRRFEAARKEALPSVTAATQTVELPVSLCAPPPEPGTVTKATTDEAVQAATWTLSNGLRVHAYLAEEARVTLGINLLGGEAEEAAAERGLTSLAFGHLGAHLATATCDARTMRAYLRAHEIQLAVQVSGESVVLRVDAPRGALERAFELLHVVLTSARVTPQALQHARDDLDRAVRAVRRDPWRLADSFCNWAVSAGCADCTTPNWKAYHAMSLEAAQARLTAVLQRAPMACVCLGAGASADVQALAARWLGSLPPRAARAAPFYDRLRVVKRVAGRRTRKAIGATREYAVLLVGFQEGTALKERKHLSQAGRILDDRLRRALGAKDSLAYQTTAQYVPHVRLGVGRLHLGLMTDPAHAAKAFKQVLALAEAFAAAGPTEAEVAGLRTSLGGKYTAWARRPDRGLDVLTRLHRFGDSVAAVETHLRSLVDVDPEAMMKVVRRVIDPKHAVAILVEGRPATR